MDVTANASPSSGSVAFKATAIRATVDARLPIVFTDPILDRRLVEEPRAGAEVDPGAHLSAGNHRRIVGMACRQASSAVYGHRGRSRSGRRRAPRPAPMPAKVRPSAPSELAQREARLRAQMEPRANANGTARGVVDDERFHWRVQSRLHPRTPMFNEMAGRCGVAQVRVPGRRPRRAVSVMAQRRQLPTRQPAGAVLAPHIIPGTRP